jgi:hypothetical protein
MNISTKISIHLSLYTHTSYPVNFRLDLSAWDNSFVLIRSGVCIFCHGSGDVISIQALITASYVTVLLIRG